mmetsp:Transcript_10574/g.20522  ORF Transcript_10574/g.20522 Transcript_10574/m.20522 type:complete len:83 (+) Transcript_10574:35-283(+)
MRKIRVEGGTEPAFYHFSHGLCCCDVAPESCLLHVRSSSERNSPQLVRLSSPSAPPPDETKTGDGLILVLCLRETMWRGFGE